MEAGRNNVIDGEIFGLLGELVKNAHKPEDPKPSPKSTIKSSSSKPKVPPMAPQMNPAPGLIRPDPIIIDPIVKVKPNSDPSVAAPHPDVSKPSKFSYPFIAILRLYTNS